MRKGVLDTWFSDKDIENQLLEVFDHLQIRNTRIVEWIRKAIKDSHKDEITFHSASVGELNQRLELVEKRFEKIYDDKIDGKITEEFYQKKFKQYTKEKDDVNETLKKHSNANTKYYELAMNIYELSQRAEEIYLKAKLTEQKRQLIKLVFAKLIVTGSSLTFTYTKAFDLLSEAVKFTNSSKMLKEEKLEDKNFEPQEKVDITGQTEHLYAQRPIWLERWYDYRTTDWPNYLEYPEFTLEQTQYFLSADFTI